MKISDKQIRKAIRESINEMNFVDSLRKINNDSNLRSWAETDAENGVSPEEGRRQRFQPSNAARSKGTIQTREFKIHTVKDWKENYMPQGISYKEYMKMEL